MESIPPNNILPELNKTFFDVGSKTYLWMLIGITLIALYYIRKKFKVYWAKRNKLKDMAKEYETDDADVLGTDLAAARTGAAR